MFFQITSRFFMYIAEDFLNGESLPLFFTLSSKRQFAR